MKLCLGTANFGMNYNGVQLKKKEIYRVLDLALEAGIKYIDTAEAYDNSEILFSYPEINKFKIITKTKNKKPQGYYAVLAHGYPFIRKNLNGASVYSPYEANLSLSFPNIKIIQLPYSVFDQRLDKAKFNRKVVIFARSVFLRGVLLNGFDYLRELQKELGKICKNYGLSRKQAALLFALDNQNIDYVVVGVDSAEHLKELIEISKMDYSSKMITELKQKFGHMGLTVPALESMGVV